MATCSKSPWLCWKYRYYFHRCSWLLSNTSQLVSLIYPSFFVMRLFLNTPHFDEALGKFKYRKTELHKCQVSFQFPIQIKQQWKNTISSKQLSIQQSTTNKFHPKSKKKVQTINNSIQNSISFAYKSPKCIKIQTSINHQHVNVPWPSSSIFGQDLRLARGQGHPVAQGHLHGQGGPKPVGKEPTKNTSGKHTTVGVFCWFLPCFLLVFVVFF